MRGSGNTEGGIGQFSVGLVLSIVSLYFFFNSVQVSSQGDGFIGRMIHSGIGDGMAGTASMGLIFVPFFLGVTALFYDARQTWAWLLMWIGVGIISIEILSRITFLFNFRLSYMLLLIVLFAAGTGLMLRSYKDVTHEINDDKKNNPE